jgi:ABC-type amino acid transport substrate-binding protein
VFLLTCTYTSFAESPASKTVRIVAFNHYPAIFKAQDNSIQGYYVDFISEIAKREGWNIEYIYGDWADGLARIKSGEVDVLTSVTLTQERTAFMDYGKAPLNTAWSELYVNKHSTIDNIRQVQGKRIAIMKGDTNGANLRNLVDKFGIPCQFVEYGNFDDIFTAISSREVDGGVVNNTFGAAKQRDFDIKSSGVIFNPFDVYFTVSKGENHTVLETLDRYLAEWRANANSPYHLARQKWSHADSGSIHIIHRWLTDALIGLAIVSIVAVAFIILLRKQVSIKTSRLTAQAGERKKIEETLFFINKCGSQYHGEDLIAALTTHLAESLGVLSTPLSASCCPTSSVCGLDGYTPWGPESTRLNTIFLALHVKMWWAKMSFITPIR